MKVLVTGANGFIGRALVERLVRDGRYTVLAAIRRDYETLPAQVKRTAGDLDSDWTDRLRGVKFVVHLAGRAHVVHKASPDSLDEYHRVNITGTAHLARSAATAGVRRFVYISSLKVHGETGCFTERDDPMPVGAYAKSKHEAEIAVRRIASDEGLDVVIVRPPLVYGPGVQANFKMLMRAIASGVPLPLRAVRNRRSLVGVDNLADFIMTCLPHPAAANETFLVADGEDLSTPDLVRRLARAMERPARMFSIPPALLRGGAFLCGGRNRAGALLDSLQADITKARTHLSWSPPFAVDEGLRRAVLSQ